ncbi:hypothetical protein [Eubacterium sp. An3]|nr:hypothetical protein [Eubacterium sp. An3]
MITAVIANEIFIEELSKIMPEDVRLPIGVGSGTINDLVHRMVKHVNG